MTSSFAWPCSRLRLACPPTFRGADDSSFLASATASFAWPWLFGAFIGQALGLVLVLLFLGRLPSATYAQSRPSSPFALLVLCVLHYTTTTPTTTTCSFVGCGYGYGCG
ncbi:hypothetical protein B0H16DRAFT_1571517 [Mycena metata]|uniref:Uncharacterized protein n=1 Tax=Mycena metata TaxID=1033252 RepID=A0AAD7MYF2_9AGAR|nr:hypothetical protein B0H16DRAFT_1571517 [Mycena metata]